MQFVYFRQIPVNSVKKAGANSSFRRLLSSLRGFFTGGKIAEMASRVRTDEEIDAILDLACFCDQMSVMKTQWFGPNAGRRYRACPTNTCGYEDWIDEEPLGPRTLEIIKEFQERGFEREERHRRRVVSMRERHQFEMNQLKAKQQFVAIIGLYVLVNFMINTNTVVEEDDYDSEDL